MIATEWVDFTEIHYLFTLSSLNFSYFYLLEGAKPTNFSQ